MLRPTLISVALLAATPAAAQSLLENFARSAAEAAVRGAVNQARTPSAGAPADTLPAAAPAPQRAGKPKPPRKRTIYDIPKPADAEEKRKAFVDFSEYFCDDCEGSRGYDSTAANILGLGGWNQFESAVGALSIGERLAWKGKANDGEIVVTAERMEGEYKCKEVTWRLTKRKGGSAERAGLFCHGLRYADSDTPRWTEIY